MYKSILIAIMKVRGINLSGIAKMVNISRQAVSLWFTGKDDFINIQVKHLLEFYKTSGIEGKGEY